MVFSGFGTRVREIAAVPAEGLRGRKGRGGPAAECSVLVRIFLYLFNRIESSLHKLDSVLNRPDTGDVLSLERRWCYTEGVYSGRPVNEKRR